MKILPVAFLYILTAFPLYSQGINDYCVKSKSLKKADLNGTFPFDRTKKIQLVSFDPAYSESIPIKDGKVDTAAFKETKKLDNEQEEKLIDILFNYTFDPQINGDSIAVSIAMCYDPRNAVLFRDKRNNIIAYLEICFECNRYRNPSGILIGDFCHDKFSMLKNFFQRNEIKFGTTESD